jgi:hypothetical protein
MKSEHYVGKKIPIQEELEEESIWQFEDKVFYVRTIGSEDSATITASALQWNKSKKKYEVEIFQVALTQLEINNSDDALFLNLKDDKDGLYKIFRLSPSTNEKDMVIFTIDTGVIKKHIKEGKVKAVKEEDGFLLKLTKEELDDYVRNNVNEIFNFGSAGVIKSLKGFKK